MSYYSVLFFQAEDGIRDVAVTGVQTCALPIYNMRGGRCNDKQVRAIGELDVAGPPIFLFVKETGCHRVFGKRLQCKIGRASCRERVEISVVAVSLKKKKRENRCTGVTHTKRVC